MNSVAVLSAEGTGSASLVGDGSLSWLNSNNSNIKLNPYHNKLARVLEENVRYWVDQVGADNIGFLTLTFAENLEDKKEADRRFNSFATGVLRKNFGAWVKVCERQKRGAWHYHLLIDCKVNIRSGYVFQRGRRKKTANKSLREIWSLLGAKYKSYGFGFRSELEPIRTNSEGISKYMAKYLGKHLDVRRKEDKGKRLISYSKDFPRPWKLGFTFLSAGSSLWRKKLASVASLMQVDDLDAMCDRYGPKWAYKLMPVIDRWYLRNEEYTPDELEIEVKRLTKETGGLVSLEDGKIQGVGDSDGVFVGYKDIRADLKYEAHLFLRMLKK